jgi:hypothetical protein
MRGDAVSSLEKALILENRMDGSGRSDRASGCGLPGLCGGPSWCWTLRWGLPCIVEFLPLGRHLPPPSLDGVPLRICQIPRCSWLPAASANHDNIGGIFRNAGAFGADAVVLDQSCCDPLYRKAIRVSVGAALRVPFCRGGSIADWWASLCGHRFEVDRAFAAWIRELSAGFSLAAGRRCCWERKVRAPGRIFKSIKTLRIEQAPGLDSLNVATTSGIALWQAARQMGRIGD